MRFLTSYFLFENLQQARSILKSHEIPETDKNFLAIRELLKSHLGYIGWFTKMFFDSGIGMNDLINLYQIISTESEIVSDLPKPIISYSDWEILMDDIIKSRNKIAVKRVINEFPQLQKSFISLSNSTEVSLLVKLSKFKDKENFYKKVSRYKTKKELIDAIKLFTTDKRKVGYTNIKDAIIRSKAKIVYDSHFDDIIICEVNFYQLRQLASDTSWCILSESTFKSYSNGIDKQYIIFLTDKTGNMSKIGITYGLKFRTAHAINDSYVDQSTISKLLDDRGTSIYILKRTMQSVLIEHKDTSIRLLLQYGFNKIDIINHCKIFKKEDLKCFTKAEIDEHHLNDRVEIEERDFKNEFVDFNFIKKNKDRFVFKLDVSNLVSVNPSPGQLDDFPVEILDDDAKDFVRLLKKQRHTILSYFKENRIPSYIDSFKSLLYTFKYCAVSSYSYDFENIVDALDRNSINLSESGFIEFYKFLKSNGFDYDADDISNLISKFSLSWYSDRINLLVGLSDKIPILLPKVKEIIKAMINNDRDILSSARINSDLLVLDSNSMSIISKRMSDIKPLLDSKKNIQKAWKNMYDVLPNNRYQGRGIGRKETQNYMKSKNRTNDVITPQQVYDDFYEILKNESWNSASSHGSDMLSTLYMIFTLVKLGKYDEIGKLKIHWSDEFTGKIIAQALGIYTYNGHSHIYDTFLPTKLQQEKLFTYLLANIKERVYYHISNVRIDTDMMRHKVFSLIYYLYDWGFNKYFDLVEKTKNVYKEKWDKVGEINYVEYENCRIDYFKHIFDYLSKKKEIDKIKELIDKIMQWKMTKSELKRTENVLAYLGGDEIGKQIKDYIFTKYFPRENRKEYERSNYW